MNSSVLNIGISDFNYPLSADQIASKPLDNRADARMLEFDGFVHDRKFSDLPDILPTGSLLVLNDTRVVAARLLFQKSSGGVIEIFCLEPAEGPVEEALQSKNETTWNCLIGGASKWKPGQVLEKIISMPDGELKLQAFYLSKNEDSFEILLKWNGNLSFASVLQAAGAMPLPPYIKRKAEEFDAERYQTVFGKVEGSVAAPTAALHFTSQVFDDLHAHQIATETITLHVGAGTFKPVTASTIGEHHMHREPFSVTRHFIEKLTSSSNVIAVGTTSLRTLESLYWLGVKSILQRNEATLTLGQWEAYELEEKSPSVSVEDSMRALLGRMQDADKLYCSTSLLIAPGYRFRIPKGLITNFHQPQSTLLLLIAAFIGADWRKVYDHALQNGYRFLSYGDSSLLWRKES